MRLDQTEILVVTGALALILTVVWFFFGGRRGS